MFTYTSIIGVVGEKPERSEGGGVAVAEPDTGFQSIDLAATGALRAEALGLVSAQSENQAPEVYGCSWGNCSCSVTGTWGCRNSDERDADLGLPGEDAIARAIDLLQ